MAKFCKKCGTNLETSSCDCSAALAANAEAVGELIGKAKESAANINTEKAEEMAKKAKNAAININNEVMEKAKATAANYDQEKVDKTVDAAKKTTTNVFNLLFKSVWKPIDYIYQTEDKANTINKALLVLIQALLIVGIAIIPMPGVETDFSDKFQMGAVGALLSCVPVFASSVLAYAASRKNYGTLTYLDIFATFAICTVPSTFLIAVAAISSVLSSQLGGVIAVVAGLSYIILSYEALMATSKCDKLSAYALALINIPCIFIGQFYIIKLVIMAIMEDTFGTITQMFSSGFENFLQ